ncbi:hypothetical protein G6F45_014069 [Rhizopus arrhizus]|nr:hypothetical protein G6F45_014069 [Rhizopus arrhizus]
MVVSSTCMNDAIARPTVHRATLGGRNPEAAPGAAGAPGAPGAAGACADMATSARLRLLLRQVALDDRVDHLIGIMQLLGIHIGVEHRSLRPSSTGRCAAGARPAAWHRWRCAPARAARS